ncbi:hypothetical protein [Legionella israelensis]|uniref:hypothetical protein n=1 Tax=Legionella israelensis TaxID=454 RepID=UPI0007315AA2|nr:hypothetical protein [Legionella israelensis]QBS09177.1 hypothetical protein E4T55_04490 [Legionella israelensis]
MNKVNEVKEDLLGRDANPNGTMVKRLDWILKRELLSYGQALGAQFDGSMKQQVSSQLENLNQLAPESFELKPN